MPGIEGNITEKKIVFVVSTLFHLDPFILRGHRFQRIVKDNVC